MNSAFALFGTNLEIKMEKMTWVNKVTLFSEGSSLLFVRA